MPDHDSFRPVLNENTEKSGIELSFTKRPSKETISELKEHGFRWHSQKQLWFAKNTPERYAFAANLAGMPAPDMQSRKTLQSPDNQKKTSVQTNTIASAPAAGLLPNTFAASYTVIGDASILPKADGGLLSHKEAFFQRENVYFRRTYGGESITILDLQNAQKPGAVCQEWHICPEPLSKESMFSILQRAGVESIPQLVDLCRSEHVPDGLSIYSHSHKGVDIFSPFIEVKPLKALPDKWTKRNFAQALMSGQLYCGEVDYYYTDDYAYDAATGFRKGIALDMPSFVMKQVGEWSSCTSCYNAAKQPDEQGSSAVHFSEHGNSSKTLWFDVNCNIAEGKRRADARAQSILRYNHMLESSCLSVSPADIDPNKCYTIVTLDKQTNSGIHDTQQTHLQGHVLQQRLAPDGFPPDILSFQELNIVPSQFYTIADFFHRREHAEDDNRIIECGNWRQIVSGKALLELTGEGVCLPVLLEPDAEYGSYQAAVKQLTNQLNGSRRFMFSEHLDYQQSLNRLESEFRRAGKPRLDALIQDASSRKSVFQLDRDGPEPSREF